MTVIDPSTEEVHRYATAVRTACADLTPAERDDLLEDLDEHLGDVLAELGEGESLEDRLGSPTTYASELRRSAGLDGGATDHQGGRAARRAARAAAWRARLDGLGTTAPGPRLRAYASSLRPAWLLLRAYLIVSAVAVLFDDHRFHPIPHLFGSSAVGLVAVAVASVWSVSLDQRPEPSLAIRRWGRALTLTGALAALVVLAKVDDPRPAVAPEDVGGGFYAPGVLTAADGSPIANIYPFAADGTPLDGVLLYDDQGRPIADTATWDLEGRELSADDRTTDDGRAISNAYPLELTAVDADGTRRPVERPNLAVPVIEASDDLGPSTTVATTTAPITTTTVLTTTTTPPATTTTR